MFGFTQVGREVVQEQHVFGAELGILDDLGHAGPLGGPVDPSEYELVPQPDRLELDTHRLLVVLRADGADDPSAVEDPDHVYQGGVALNRSFAEGATPERVVQVPDDHLDRCREPTHLVDGHRTNSRKPELPTACADHRHVRPVQAYTPDANRAPATLPSSHRGSCGLNGPGCLLGTVDAGRAILAGRLTQWPALSEMQTRLRSSGRAVRSSGPGG